MGCQNEWWQWRERKKENGIMCTEKNVEGLKRHCEVREKGKKITGRRTTI